MSEFWGVFISGFVGGACSMVVIYSWLRDRRTDDIGDKA